MPKSTKDADTQSTERRVDMGARGDIIAPTTPGAMEYDYTNFYFGAGSDAFALLEPFDEWWREVKPAGY